MLRGCMQRHTIKCNFFSRDAYVIQVTVGRVYHPMKLVVLIPVFLGQVALDSVVTKDLHNVPSARLAAATSWCMKGSNCLGPNCQDEDDCIFFESRSAKEKCNKDVCSEKGTKVKNDLSKES